MLEMKRLRLLWELSARGTIAAVADALNYSPSAVSQQLSILEREAGIPLMRRVGRTLELTPAAEALVVETGQLLAGLERAEAVLHRAHDEVIGVIRVAIFQSVMHAFMPRVLHRLRRDHPGLRLELVEYEPEDALYETWTRGFDLVVAEQYPGHAPMHFGGLDREPLTQDPIRLALPYRHVGMSREESERDVRAEWLAAPDDPLSDAFDRVRGLSDAADLPWVMEPKGAASRHFAEQTCRSAGFEPDVRYETPDLSAHVKLVESGNAVALLPGLVHIGEGHRVRFVELEGRPQRTVFTAARAAEESHPALNAVRSALMVGAEELDFATEQ